MHNSSTSQILSVNVLNSAWAGEGWLGGAIIGDWFVVARKLLLRLRDISMPLFSSTMELLSFRNVSLLNVVGEAQWLSIKTMLAPCYHLSSGS